MDFSLLSSFIVSSYYYFFSSFFKERTKVRKNILKDYSDMSSSYA